MYIIQDQQFISSIYCNIANRRSTLRETQLYHLDSLNQVKKIKDGGRRKGGGWGGEGGEGGGGKELLSNK